MNPTEELEKLGEPEVRKRLANSVYGDTRNPNYISVQSWLRSKELEREEARDEESLSISRKALITSEDANRIALEANSFSTDANSIARKALSNSKTANIWAAIATLIAAIAMYIAYIKTP